MQSQKRWGIVALAVVMFFVTTIARQSYGNSISMFGAAWIILGWYAYKGNLKLIKLHSKWWIFAGLALVVFTYMFVGDNSRIAMSIKNDLAIGVAIMLIPLVILYMFMPNEVSDIAEDLNTKHVHQVEDPNPHAKKKSNDDSSQSLSMQNKPPTMIASTNVSVALPSSDEVYFELAMDEFEANRRKGLWIKLLTLNEGDEIKSKFQYIKIRAKEIQDHEVAEFAKQQELAKLEEAENLRREIEKKRAGIASTGFFKNRSFSYTEYMDGRVVVRHDSSGSMSEFKSLSDAKRDFRE